MSNITVTNVNGRDVDAGQVKAWANINGNTIAVASSHNISSVTDIASGPEFAPSFINSFSNTDYLISSGGRQVSGCLYIAGEREAPTTSACHMLGFWFNPNGSSVNDADVAMHVQFIGDLA